MNRKTYCLISGLVDRSHDGFILKHSKFAIPFSAINYNRKIIEAFLLENKHNIIPLATTGIPAYPRFSDLKKIKPLPCYGSNTIAHNNLLGIRNISEMKAFKKQIKKMESVDYAVVSNLHSPFLYAAKILKKKHKAKMIVIVYDLPQFMSFTKRSFIYHVLKTIDKIIIKRYLKHADAFILVSEATNAIVNKHNKPYVVLEGIIEDKPMLKPSMNKVIMYSGLLAFAYDIKLLIESFIKANEKVNNSFTLELYGSGDAIDYILDTAKLHPEIKYMGMVSPKELTNARENAFAFINPRRNVEEFTKYSFPSKNLEYLQTGKPVIGFHFPSASENLNELVFAPKDNEGDLANAIERVMSLSQKEIKIYQQLVLKNLKPYRASNYIKVLQELI